MPVFLCPSGSSSSNGGVTNPMCGAGGYSVPQGQGASFFCRPSLYGRYVTIRSTLSNALALCEVEVYSARRGMLSSTMTDLLRPSLFLSNIRVEKRLMTIDIQSISYNFIKLNNERFL